jgi:hypothetical protein
VSGEGKRIIEKLRDFNEISQVLRSEDYIMSEKTEGRMKSSIGRHSTITKRILQ